MRFFAMLFITTGTFICCLPACSSDVTCIIKPDKEVFAFPSNILTKRTSTNSIYYFNFQVVLNLDTKRLEAGSRKRSKVEYYSMGERIKLQDCYTEESSEPDRKLLQQKINLTVNANCIFEWSKVKKIGQVVFWFKPVYESNNHAISECVVAAKFVLDYAPSVLFKKALIVSPGKLINDTSDYLNETCGNVVELKINNIDNVVEVQLQVNDNDHFVNKTYQFEFCAVSQPNITLSVVVTLHNSSKMSNTLTPLTPNNQPLATDDGLNEGEGAWWKRNSSRVNETLINVRLDFAVSALCAAIHGLLNSSGHFHFHLSLDSYSVAYVNITLNVTATSGTTNPRQSTGTLTLQLVFKGGCKLIGATAQSYTVTTVNKKSGAEQEQEQDLIPGRTAYSDTVTTANEETGTTNFNVLIVVIGVALSVIPMFVLIALAVKYRAHLLRLYTSIARRHVDDRNFVLT